VTAHASDSPSEDPFLDFLGLGGREALRVREGLAADVVGGNARQVRLRHPDEVAEDLVEPDLEGGTPCALPLARLDLREESLAAPGRLAQRVERGVVPVADEAPLLVLAGGSSTRLRSRGSSASSP